jgi:hypothetical protein
MGVFIHEIIFAAGKNCQISFLITIAGPLYVVHLGLWWEFISEQKLDFVR